MQLDEIIKYENENTFVDFKKTQYSRNEDLIKDIMAMANADSDVLTRYIIVGVKLYPGGDRDYHAIPEHEFKDDADYQQIIRQYIEPEIKFSYFPYHFEENRLGIIKIYAGQSRPYLLKRQLGNLNPGDGYIRRGSQQARLIREDLEVIYEDRYRKQREQEIKNSYLHLLRHEYRNNKDLLWIMNSYITEGRILKEIWEAAGEISNHFVFEAWDSLMRSGLIASLAFGEMDTYRYAVKTVRDAIRSVRTAKANWLRLWDWDKVGQGENVKMISQPIPKSVTLQQSIHNCREAIKIAQNALDSAIQLLESTHQI
ncbi:AlbA family DNA-binding domain-containing protein [Paenibacillus sp. MMO-177]|uniref:AlbA family DNA-binding domain-containing protein n=1 Tax=Paenibacillus sp. MMO-177 TaxID=3081289 RepID=UPI003017EB99